MSRYDALQLALSQELDLVEVSPTAEPPVCRIIDYGKFLFEQNKKAHTAKRKQKQTQVKEVKFRPNTDDADYQIKLRNLIRFLSEGDKAEKTDREFMYQGISTRRFKRQFNLADYVHVKSAAFDNGLLKIELVREIPEAMKPRRIAVKSSWK